VDYSTPPINPPLVAFSPTTKPAAAAFSAPFLVILVLVSPA